MVGTPAQTSEQAILAAAEDLFLERGYGQTSTVEIAKRAGCNQTLVHYYFRSKENLFQSIFAHKFQQAIQTFIRVEEEYLPFEQAIARMVESHFDFLLAHPRLPFLMLAELTTNPARIEAMKALVAKHAPLAMIESLDRRLREAIAQGAVRPLSIIDLFLTAVSLNVMLFISRPMVMNVLQLSEAQFAEFIQRRRREHVDIVLRSLRP